MGVVACGQSERRSSAATDRTRAPDLNHPRTDQRHRRAIVVICDIVSNEHKKIKKNQNDMRPTLNVVICDIVARKKYKHGLWIIDRKWFPQNSYLV